MSRVMLLSDSWPDAFDLWVLGGYMLLAIGLPVAGYVLLAFDIRAHYRRLRRALVVVTHYTGRLPRWVLNEAREQRRIPPCVAAFGLEIPFTEEQLLEAYRHEVKLRHPDRGGNRADFLQLQRYFEEARSLLSSAQ